MRLACLRTLAGFSTALRLVFVAGAILAVSACASQNGPEAGGLSATDQMIAGAAIQVALSSTDVGEVYVWNNPANGTNGIVSPTRKFTGSDGHDCAEFRATMTAGAGTQSMDHTACQNAEGAWVPAS